VSRPFIIGLTGGIASGKSTVAALFAARGVTVIDLDQVARDVVAPGTALLARVLERFGPDLRLPDGSLDRRALRRRVFADADERRALEALLHPAIRRRTEELVAACHDSYLIIVNPLLVESGDRNRYERVLLVDCDEAQQRARLQLRDGSNPAEAAAVLAAQATRAARQSAADDIIVNDGDREALRHRVADLHQRYLGLAPTSSTIRQ